MNLELFGNIRFVVQIAGAIIFCYAAFRKLFQRKENRLFRTLIGISIALFFGIEFVGEIFLPGFMVLVTPRWLRIGIFCYGLFLIFTPEKMFFN